MPRTAIHTELAPAAIGPYSQATRAGDLVFFSGQVPLDPATGQLVEGDDIAVHARRAFDFRDDPRPEEKLATEDAARWAAQFMHQVLDR